MLGFITNFLPRCFSSFSTVKIDGWVRIKLTNLLLPIVAKLEYTICYITHTMYTSIYKYYTLNSNCQIKKLHVVSHAQPPVYEARL